MKIYSNKLLDASFPPRPKRPKRPSFPKVPIGILIFSIEFIDSRPFRPFRPNPIFRIKWSLPQRTPIVHENLFK